MLIRAFYFWFTRESNALYCAVLFTTCHDTRDTHKKESNKRLRRMEWWQERGGECNPQQTSDKIKLRARNGAEKSLPQEVKLWNRVGCVVCNFNLENKFYIAALLKLWTRFTTFNNAPNCICNVTTDYNASYFQINVNSIKSQNNCTSWSAESELEEWDWGCRKSGGRMKRMIMMWLTYKDLFMSGK